MTCVTSHQQHCLQILRIARCTVCSRDDAQASCTVGATRQSLAVSKRGAAHFERLLKLTFVRLLLSSEISDVINRILVMITKININCTTRLVCVTT